MAGSPSREPAWPASAPFSTGRGGKSEQETLHVRNENGQCVFAYERRGNEDQLTIDVRISADRSVRQVLLRRTPHTASAIVPVEFKQVANEKITLTLGRGRGSRCFLPETSGSC